MSSPEIKQEDVIGRIVATSFCAAIAVFDPEEIRFRIDEVTFSIEYQVPNLFISKAEEQLSQLAFTSTKEKFKTLLTSQFFIEAFSKMLIVDEELTRNEFERKFLVES